MNCKENKKCCNICDIPYFERNNYYYGKLMTVRDFQAEQCYFNEKRWLINRMIHGWGVVCGLDVKPKDGEKDKVVVTPGLAIDCCGREILVSEETEVPLEPEESECDGQKKEDDGRLIICIEFNECKAEPINLPPIACDQKDKCEFNRIRDNYRIRVVPFYEQKPQNEPFCPADDYNELLDQYLCERLRKGCYEWEDSICIILAIVKMDTDGKLDIDTCSRRRLVYSNPLLYDLINCFKGDIQKEPKKELPGPY